eukprot:11272949-Ditylum_brightwellii.AAC.1
MSGTGSNLFSACKEGDLGKVSEILQTLDKGDINKVQTVRDCGNGCYTPLFLAIQHCNKELVQLLLDWHEKEDVALTINHSGYWVRYDHATVYADDWTPLHAACASGNKEVIQLLLDRGNAEQCNTSNKHGWTPLHVACCHAPLDIVQLLVDKPYRADIEMETNDGELPCEIAANKGFWDVEDFLWSRMR